MTRLLVLSVGLLTLAACAGPDYLDEGPGAFSEGNVQGRMAGDMPITGEFDDELSTGYLWRGSGYLEFDLHATGSHGWAMLGGGFEPMTLDDGESIVLDPYEHWVFGCSGPQEWNAEFDEPAEEVTVSKSVVDIDGRPMAEITVTAEFANGSDVTAVLVRPVPGDGGDD